ncbi:MAG: hypothetical protein ACXAEF_07875 [Candidatus Thorarchaeota archaeon]
MKIVLDTMQSGLKVNQSRTLIELIAGFMGFIIGNISVVHSY